MSELLIIEWGSALEFGTSRIESEHLVIVTLFNDLIKSIERPISCQMRHQFLASLERHARVHFAHEEEDMKRSGFPEIAVHRQKHQYFLEIIDSFNKNPVGFSDRKIIALMRKWLIDHIFTDDRNIYIWIAHKQCAPHST